jgi:hypothetical protein
MKLATLLKELARFSPDLDVVVWDSDYSENTVPSLAVEDGILVLRPGETTSTVTSDDNP